MKPAGRIFAEITVLLEDMHGCAVDGQARDVSPDMRLLLIVALHEGAARLDLLMVRAERLSGTPTS